VSLPAREFFTSGEFHAFVCAIIDADAFCFDDALAEYGQQVVLFRNEVNGLQVMCICLFVSDFLE